MSHDFRRAVRLIALSALGLALPAAAGEVAATRVGGEPVLSISGLPVAAVGSGASAIPALAAPSAPASVVLLASPLTPVSALASMPAAVLPEASAAGMPALVPPAIPAAARSASSRGPSSAAAPSLDGLRSVVASGADSGADFDGGRSRARSAAVAAPPARGSSRGPKGFIKNADGVWVDGRVAEQAIWIGRMYSQLSSKIDLSDVMDVMDDAYSEAAVKLRFAEKVAVNRKLAASSVHLEGTRNWVDAILTDAEHRNIAIHTHRVYFHPARGNPASEISEGIRRVDKYLDKAKSDFAPGGLAEKEFRHPFAQVELNFDTRGYQEIADHIAGRAAEFREAFGDRFVFSYVTEPKMASKPLRAEYNRLVELYADQSEGLKGILDGVTYSREVGVGHELNSHLMRMRRGLKIVQAGRDFFADKTLPGGETVKQYVTEFDAVTEPAADAAKPSKDRDVVLWEDKSARVWLPLSEVMEQTFLYKLRIYRDNRGIIEQSLGGAPLKVAFSVDVGGLDRQAAKQGVLVWKDERQKALKEHLEQVAPELSREYGFPVSFVFVNSHPNENPDLFYSAPVGMEQWRASQERGRPKGGRRRGRRKQSQ